jgi:hypothetical protein
MKSLGLNRYALAIGAASALLAGCGGSKPPISASGAMPQSHAIATHAAHGKSWMLPEAKSTDLLYATGGICGGICVLSYPAGKLVGSIAVTGALEGDCSDSMGNVYVTNDTQVLKFVHGGTVPSAELSLPGNSAQRCAVDPETGDLAVTFNGDSGSNIAIFTGATGKATVYNTGQGAETCGYDNHGNLFVSSYYDQSNDLAELPYGASTFTAITFDYDHGYPNHLQWDGSYMTWESAGKKQDTILRFTVSGSNATMVGSTQIKGPAWMGQSWIYGDRVVLPYSSSGGFQNKIGIWRYPKSGKVAVKFGNFGQSKTAQINAVTVSVPASARLESNEKT